MITQALRLLVSRPIARLAFALALHGLTLAASAQGTAFTYQGRLLDNGAPANGLYDLRFELRDALVAGNPVGLALTNAPVAVSNGVFTVTLDFGAGMFTGAARFLEIGVRTNTSVLAHTLLIPRQALTAVPYAIRAAESGSAVTVSGTLAASQITGPLTAAQLPGTAARTDQANTFTGNQTVTGDMNAARLSVGAGHSLTGSGASIAGGVNNVNSANRSFIGGGEQNTIQTSATNSTIGGGYLNTIRTDAYYSTIAGGHGNAILTSAFQATIAGGHYNTIREDAFGGTIGGGALNTIQTNANYATIGGGYINTIQTNAQQSTIAGGFYNTIQTNAPHSTIGGGRGNTIQPNAYHSTIGGGLDNTIQTNAYLSTIGGGNDNRIQTDAPFATIPGGSQNSATNYAFAAGRQAKANHTGAFVWADSTSADIASAAANSVTMRAAGGYRLFSDQGATLGVTLAANGGAWSSISDRNAKKDFAPVDGLAVLEKLAAVPVLSWRYKAEAADSVPHLGPVAQDFKAAFFPGRDDKSISTLEFDGVELAAIQGLHQMVKQQDTALKAKDAQIATLEQRMADLEKLVRTLAK